MSAIQGEMALILPQISTKMSTCCMCLAPKKFLSEVSYPLIKLPNTFVHHKITGKNMHQWIDKLFLIWTYVMLLDIISMYLQIASQGCYTMTLHTALFTFTA